MVCRRRPSALNGQSGSNGQCALYRRSAWNGPLAGSCAEETGPAGLRGRHAGWLGGWVVSKERVGAHAAQLGPRAKAWRGIWLVIAIQASELGPAFDPCRLRLKKDALTSIRLSRTQLGPPPPQQFLRAHRRSAETGDQGCSGPCRLSAATNARPQWVSCQTAPPSNSQTGTRSRRQAPPAATPRKCFTGPRRPRRPLHDKFFQASILKGAT